MRGRCQRCLFAGELYGVSEGDGRQVRRWRLCEHCAMHMDINCALIKNP